MKKTLVKMGKAVASLVIGGGIFLLLERRNDNKKNNAPIIYLFGKIGVGKDTIREIFLKARFEEKSCQTIKVYKDQQKICGKWLQIWNTGGSDSQDTNNMQAKEELEKQSKQGIDVYYTYVFKVNDYLNKKEVAQKIELDLESAQKHSGSQNFKFIIIGTHRDKVDKKDEIKINDLADKLSQKYGGRCKIWDLTRASEKGRQMQKELVEFITKEE